MKPLSPRMRAKGFSLIELMVAMTIALTISLAIFAAMSTFEGRKRSNTSSNDASQAGNYAAFILDKWIRSAGSGFSQTTDGSFDYVMCQLHAMNSGTQTLPRTASLPAPFDNINTGTANQFRLVPLLILPGQTTPNISGQASDAIVLMAGAGGLSEAAGSFRAAPSSSLLSVYNVTGFRANDMLLIARKGSTGACLIEQASATSNSNLNAQTITLGGSFYSASINGKSLTGAEFCGTASNAQAARKCSVISLGNLATTSGSPASPPGFLVIGVGNNNTLVAYDLLQILGSQPFPIADNVYSMHARYGIDTNNDGRVDAWTAATGNYAPAALTAADGSGINRICSIKAIRVGLVLRTSVREQANVSNTTLTLFSDIQALTVTLNDPKYRYQAIETTIPLRNLISTTCPSS